MTMQEFFEAAGAILPAGTSYKVEAGVWRHCHGRYAPETALSFSIWDGRAHAEGMTPELALAVLRARHAPATRLEDLGELPTVEVRA